MSRTPVLVRDSVLDDADALVEVWAGMAGRAEAGEPPPPARSEAAASITRMASNPDQRLLVACIDGRVVGAVQLNRGSFSPVHAEHAVYLMHLQVLDRFRRHGVGRALLAAAVTWAEETASTFVVGAASVASRDANRFMARLGLGQIATLRGATVGALRAKLPVEPPAVARVGTGTRSHRSVGQVLVKRRSMRRAASDAGSGAG